MGDLRSGGALGPQLSRGSGGRDNSALCCSYRSSGTVVVSSEVVESVHLDPRSSEGGNA